MLFLPLAHLALMGSALPRTPSANFARQSSIVLCDRSAEVWAPSLLCDTSIESSANASPRNRVRTLGKAIVDRTREAGSDWATTVRITTIRSATQVGRGDSFKWSSPSTKKAVSEVEALLNVDTVEAKSAPTDGSSSTSTKSDSILVSVFAQAMKKQLEEEETELFSSFAKAVKATKEEDSEVRAMRRQAEAGDGWAMHALGHWYGNGEKGLPKDSVMAFEWIQKSHEAGCAAGTSELGRCYLNGEGVKQNTAHGMTLLCEAAMLGSQCACFNLGDSYANGFNAIPKDLKQAKRWFDKVAKATIEDLNAPRVWEASWLSQWLSQQPARSEA
jgi:hypothetical protein